MRFALLSRRACFRWEGHDAFDVEIVDLRVMSAKREKLPNVHPGEVLEEEFWVETRGVYFSTGEWTVRPLVTYKPNDDLQFTAGAEIYRGPDETLFGVIEDAFSTVFVEAKVSF